MVSQKRQIGDAAEALAQAYLIDKGCKVIATNFHCRFGELDCVATHKNAANTLIIVEVRARQKNSFGTASATIDHYKQRKLISATEIFLQQHPKYQHYAVRFDVIGLDLASNKIEWITDAFRPGFLNLLY